MPVSARVPTADVLLTSHAGAPAQARRILTTLAAHGTEVAERGELLVSEAVTNAVEHTSSAHVQLSVTMDHRAGELFCAVHDTDPRLPAPPPVPTGNTEGIGDAGDAELGESGRGMGLIDSLSDAWGCVAGSRGKWVWFHLSPGQDAGTGTGRGTGTRTGRPTAGTARTR